MNYLEDIRNSVLECDKLLIGIGTSLEYSHDGALDVKSFEDFYKGIKELVGDKDYYIITLSKDDLIFKYLGEDARVTAPCGSVSRYQCENACVNIEDERFANYDGRVILSVDEGTCPVCGGRLVPNNILAEHYAEEGYLKSFADYKKWLQGTVNRKLCILELGVNLKYPGVIRFAFDKLCYYNQKSTFYRVDEKLYQHTAENKERGISVPMKPIALFN